MSTRIRKINTRAVLDMTEKQINTRLKSAAISLTNFIKASYGAGGGRGKRKGGSKKSRKANTSKPGNPPNVDTGLLRAATSYSYSDGPGRGKVGSAADTVNGVSRPERENVVRIGHNTSYGMVLEFGTKDQSILPRPHLRRGFDLHKAVMKKIIEQGGVGIRAARAAVKEEKAAASIRSVKK